MILAGIDLDGSRARAVFSSPQHPLALAPLDGEAVELPLCIGLAEKKPRIGSFGLALVRRRPHLVCSNFLAALGTDRTWSAERHRIGAERACAILCETLFRALPGCNGIVAATPGYLDEGQVDRLQRVAQAAKMPLFGTAPTSLLAASAAESEDGLTLVVEVDEQALVWSVAEQTGQGLQLRFVHPSRGLSRPAWLAALVNGAADRCVWQCRRDPRESGEAEQSLHEEFVRVLSGDLRGVVHLPIQGPDWDHQILLPANELAAFTRPLLRRAMDEVRSLPIDQGALSKIVLTHEAARLPGLASALRSYLPATPVALPEGGDYGEALVKTAGESLRVLGPDDVAIAAHDLAGRIHRGEARLGSRQALPPRMPQQPSEEGPARLNFRGRDHLLSANDFTLGRDPTCDLVFESALYPHVSGRHCQIQLDRRAYVLLDRSRHGTQINDRPVQARAALRSGDWICLGPSGPLLRFLGQPPVLT